MQQHFLRQQNYQLKNEITDLKNAFDLNRDILKILHNYNEKTDPHFNLLMQIITRLTSVNNQAMLNNIDLIHQKNVLKQENLKLNLEVNAYEVRLQREVELNLNSNQPNQSKLIMHEQFNSLNRELMAANEERIIKEQQIQFWKARSQNQSQHKNNHMSTSNSREEEVGEKIKRRYISNNEFKYQILYGELQKQNRRLKQHVQQLENKLLIFIKAYNLEESAMNNQISQAQVPFFETEREEIRLLKYALNDIHIDKQDNEWTLTITQRFKPKQVTTEEFKERRSSSWPKHCKVEKVEKRVHRAEQKFMEEEREREMERRY